MDSKLVVEQMSGRWQIKDPGLRALAARAREAASGLGKISYTWVPRARNARADRLANQAMDAARPGQGSGGDGQAASRSARVVPAAPAADPHPVAAPPAWGPPHGTPTTTLLLRHGQTPLSAGGADSPGEGISR